ncbi:g11362 [Coccomyxa viridis]|uniref:G11362 protein n=1 Tax=Coccomyxa viridis TaxID=1274662 RepID=A0ABP1G7X8_9CHLO
MLKGMRGRRKALTVEPEIPGVSSKCRSQTPTQALTAILDGQCGTQTRRRNQREVKEALLNKVPACLQESEFPCWRWQEYDKAFACEWLDTENVVIGTKCNRLLLLNTTTRKVTRVPIPPAPPRASLQQAAADSNSAYGNCGIHSISISPDREFLATGGSNPADCQIMRIRDGANACTSQPTLEPVQTLVGHTDWVFGATWVTDRHVVTGSRDQQIKLWKVDADEPAAKPNTQPLYSVLPLKPTGREENYKVRDVKYDRQLGRVVTLTTNGAVQLWDPHLSHIRTVRLKHSKEVVCLAMTDSLVAVGSQSHVSLIDPRKKTPVQEVESLDHSHGVRSLTFLDHLLSCGSGRGRMFFYDMRAAAYLELDPLDAPPVSQNSRPGSTLPDRTTNFLQCGPGYLNQTDAVYLEHFHGEQVFNACYSHAWDPTSTRLMCVGGPLAYGLRGCYMALWD